MIEEKKDVFYLNSYSKKGIWLGDTLHTTIEEAMNKAEFDYKEFGNPKIEWKKFQMM